MQVSHTGKGIDLAKLAAACGFAETIAVSRIDEVRQVAAAFRQQAKGPRLAVLKVRAENVARTGSAPISVFHPAEELPRFANTVGGIGQFIR
jgi:hypothetical protein